MDNKDIKQAQQMGNDMGAILYMLHQAGWTDAEVKALFTRTHDTLCMSMPATFRAQMQNHYTDAARKAYANKRTNPILNLSVQRYQQNKQWYV